MHDELRQKIIECGDALFEKGQIALALCAYTITDATAKIIACGDASLALEKYDDAVEAYSTAGAIGRLDLCGQICLQNEQYATAARALGAAGKRIPRNRIIAAGDIHFLTGQFETALQAYVATLAE